MSEKIQKDRKNLTIFTTAFILGIILTIFLHLIEGSCSPQLAGFAP